MSKSKSRKFADILSGNLATVLDDGIISASEVASLGTAATTDATAYATAAQGTTADNALPKAGGAMTGAITTNSTFDGRDVATDGTKLDGIETGATADQTAAQILTAIKTVDGTSSGLDADLLDGQQGSYYTNYADTAVANLTDSAPATLNTLNELAAALGDDASFSTTVTNSIATKLPLAGGTMTGNIAHAGNFTIDAGGDITLDADGGEIFIADGGTNTGVIQSTTNSDLVFRSLVSDKDLILKGNDGGATITALTLDMSNAGRATFNENIVVAGTVDGRDIATDGTKLDTIETNATADQTDAEIRAAVEAATDSNVFTDADHSKLNAIEASADVTDVANVVSSLTAGTNITIAANGTISSTDTNTTYSVQDGELSQNNFTDADHTKLNSIETNADVTDTTNVVAALTAGTNVAIAANGTISSTDTNTTYSVGDGGLTQKNFTTTLKSKLDAIESGATADQSASEISGLEEFVEDQIGANIIGGTNVSVSYNDTTGQTTLSSTDTNTTYSAGGGLGLSGTTFSHTDTSSQASVNNSGRTYIQDITLDTYGHITGISSATETVVNTNTTYSVGDGGLTQKNFTTTLKSKLDGIASSATNVTNNNQLTNGAGYITSYVNTTYSAGAGLDLSGTTFSIESDLRGEMWYMGRDTNDYFAVDPTAMNWYLDGNNDMRLENDGDLHVDGNVIAYSTTTSDERLKKDIVKIDNALDKVSQLSGYTFEYLADGKKSAGVIAQEVEKVMPSAVSETTLPLKMGEDDKTQYKTVQYDQLHGLLIEAIKELKAEIEELKNGSTR